MYVFLIDVILLYQRNRMLEHLELIECIKSSACWKEVSQYLQVCCVMCTVSYAYYAHGLHICVQSTKTLHAVTFGWEPINIWNMKCLCRAFHVSLMKFLDLIWLG